MKIKTDNSINLNRDTANYSLYDILRREKQESELELEERLDKKYRPNDVPEEVWKYDISDTQKEEIAAWIYKLSPKEQELPIFYVPEQPSAQIYELSESEFETNNFIQNAKQYLSSDHARDFNQYLTNNQQRYVVPINGVCMAHLGQNTYAAVQSSPYSAILLGNKDKDFRRAVFEFATNYGVSTEAAKLYLFMHEHAHLSQEHLRQYGHTAAERDVEQIIGAYARQQISLYQGKPESNLYKQVQQIAEQRFFEVNRNYGSLDNMLAA